ncbi:MAG: hypothetical protein KF718_08295 [Polyangiaceae bacterium]|nr:hypothetical protein [Polyangiaceae bacterium]
MLLLGLGAAAGCSRGCEGSRVEPIVELCRSTCSALGCQASSPAAEACQRRCRIDSSQADDAGCSQPRRALLACVAAHPFECSDCAGAACYELRRATACASQAEDLEACLGPCRLAGLTSQASRPLGDAPGAPLAHVHLTLAGCAPCEPHKPSGAGPGSACEAASVCDDHCCTCPNGRLRFRARACVGGQCATAAETCSAARSVPKRDPCAE